MTSAERILNQLELVGSTAQDLGSIILSGKADESIGPEDYAYLAGHCSGLLAVIERFVEATKHLRGA